MIIYNRFLTQFRDAAHASRRARIGKIEMALTKDFRETIRERAKREPPFRCALLQEAIEQVLADGIESGKAIIRNYLNAIGGR